MRSSHIGTVGLLVLLFFAMVSLAAPRVQTFKRGIMTYNGVEYPPLTIENNSKYNATCFYRRDRILSIPYSTTEVTQ